MRFHEAIKALPLALRAAAREARACGSEPFFDPEFNPQLEERARHREHRSDMTEALFKVRATSAR